jgi:hypothetical protein
MRFQWKKVEPGIHVVIHLFYNLLRLYRALLQRVRGILQAVNELSKDCKSIA